LAKNYDRGTGAPILVIPGLQGRWEWMRPALDALAARRRTISYSVQGTTFDELVEQVDDVLDRKGLESAAICGVSFGGLVAVKYAASRPRPTTALILVSCPSPAWTPNPIQARYLARPWSSTPAFLATTPGRLYPEIAAALDGPVARLRFSVTHVGRILAAPIVPAGMAARMRLNPGLDLRTDCARVAAPALVVTGERHLDRVVPVESTREYLDLICGAKYAMMERTGHLGLITRPERFARIVGDFVDACSA